jgi:hypothetical protein
LRNADEIEITFMNSIVVCSFYTDDEYYRNHANTLRADLDRLDVEYVLEEIVKKDDQSWADLCRQKVPFLNSVCERFPNKKVFWIDVDCRLLSLPDFVRNSSADIIGFQRGFGSSLSIGYKNRARFWEPCFWGVGTGPNARKMMKNAAEIEVKSNLVATDDYFFEEAWRINANSLTFQMIPGACVIGKGNPYSAVTAFFKFGSSGNVSEFKGKVMQHKSVRNSKRSPRSLALRIGKRILKKLPKPIGRRIISFSDRIGLTSLIVSDGATGVPAPLSINSNDRKNLQNQILREGMNGNLINIEVLAERFELEGITTTYEKDLVSAARAYANFSSRSSDSSITLAWWAPPFPGNFGDWLSPLIISKYTNSKIVYHKPSDVIKKHHLISTGSIGRFIKSSSIVIGTGISSNEFDLHPRAQYISVRGPLTAQQVKKSGGPSVESFGDPGAILSRVIPLKRSVTNGRTALVRHFKHVQIPIQMPENFDELSVLMSEPKHIVDFLTKLITYDRVVTSAMHIAIACQSYGIPFSLITFEDFEDMVHGDGLKYGDYFMGVGLEPINPVAIKRDFNSPALANIERNDVVSEAKKDEIEEAIRRGIQALDKSR